MKLIINLSLSPHINLKHVTYINNACDDSLAVAKWLRKGFAIHNRIADIIESSPVLNDRFHSLYDKALELYTDNNKLLTPHGALEQTLVRCGVGSQKVQISTPMRGALLDAIEFAVWGAEGAQMP